MSQPSLFELTRELEAAADGGASAPDVVERLRRQAPGLAAQIESDGQRRELLSAWGSSATSDASNPGVAIVHPAVLDAIGRLAGGVDMSGTAVHAGLMHTYGYLLSNTETPYGFKRQRYTEGSIAAGLGLEPRDLLSPSPSRGTLLSNLTDLAAWITDGSGLAIDRFVEHAAAQNLWLYTELAAFPRPEEVKGTHLLVYSLQLGNAARQLITAFPTENWMRGKLIKRAEKSAGREDVPIRLRYNARLRGFEGIELSGTVDFESSA